MKSIRDIDSDSEEELFTKKKKEKEEEIEEKANLQHCLTEEYNYEFPTIELLDNDNEIKEIIQSKEYIDSQSKTIFGLKSADNAKIIDLKETSHILIAGDTQTGKTTLIDNIIINILYKSKSYETKILIIDTNGNGLNLYNGIPHLLIPVITDLRRATGALNWVVQEIENRVELFARNTVKSFEEYNKIAEEKNEPQLPNLVVIIDEILGITINREAEEAIIRIACKGDTAGVYLIFSTNKPFNNCIPKDLKSNVYTMLSFYCPIRARSKLVLDMYGTEKLKNIGDVLFKSLGKTIPQRYHCPYISTETITNVVKSFKGKVAYDTSVNEFIENSIYPELTKKYEDDEEDDDGTDELLEEAINYVIQYQTASATFLQTKLKVGYSRCRRILDQIEERGIISGYQGSKPRTVLITPERWEELNAAPSGGGVSDDEYEDEEYDNLDVYEDEYEDEEKEYDNKSEEYTKTEAYNNNYEEYKQPKRRTFLDRLFHIGEDD